MKRTMYLILCVLFVVAALSAVSSTTASERSDQNLISVPGSSITLKLWQERAQNGELATFYQISQGGKLLREAQASYELGLRYAHFDPLQDLPAIEPRLMADENSHLYMVQFVTQPLEEFQRDITAAGGIVRHYIAQFAYLVEMNETVLGRVAQLPYVRWIGPYHPAYRLDEATLQNLRNLGMNVPSIRYNIQVLDVPQKFIVADRIAALGGIVDRADAGKMIVEATLNGGQLLQVAQFDEVNFIDVWGPYESDMDIVRQIGGANYLETMTGFSGEDVRGEIFDGGCNFNHQEFNPDPIAHGAYSVDAHGTACMGVNFADGVVPQARGLLPDGQGIFADYSTWGLNGGGRYTCAQELVNPAGPYYGVFQTASVGPPQTPQYTTISAEADQITFDFNLIACQSQSNMGNQNSRPQAWGKNMVSGGALYHYNTLDRADDMWNYGASIGPATDNRIKPSFTHFYDQVYTTYSTSNTGYGQFSGTSNATPCIAGHFGLFFQMWDAQSFGNTVPVPGGSVFENRPHATTARAMIISSCYQYPFTGLTDDKTRTHQGWGMPDLQNLYNSRNNYYIRDEVDVLLPLEVDVHQVTVNAGSAELKVVMVYSDPPGNPANQSQHRINDLTLKVTSPTTTVYWGNNGLYTGVWSTSGGSADTKNTEECVFIQNPTAGQWTIEVQGNEIIQDSHRETPALDADYALVVKGVGAVVVPDINITLTPIGGPIEILPGGGNFSFTVVLATGPSPVTYDVWTMDRAVSGTWTGPQIGPVNLTQPASWTVTRTRTQNVPISAEAGLHYYVGYVGQYSTAKWDSSYFTYTKLTSGDGPIVDNWNNYGESFDEFLTPTAWAQPVTQYSLNQNYPNPFNPTTTLEFLLPQAGQVRLAVYDLSGRLISTVTDGYREAGVHKVTFDGSGLASGIYLYRIEAGQFTAMNKMILMK